MNNNISFEQWMALVDKEISQLTGFTSEDLADIDYRSRFNDGASPAEAAEDALMNEGWKNE